MDEFTVKARVSGTLAVVMVAGDLDAATAAIFRERLQSVIADGARRLVLDLRRVTFIESVALGVIIAVRKHLGGGEKSLCVVLDQAQTSIRKIFKVTGLDGVLPVHPTPEAAEDDCADDQPAA